MVIRENCSNYCILAENESDEVMREMQKKKFVSLYKFQTIISGPDLVNSIFCNEEAVNIGASTSSAFRED